MTACESERLMTRDILETQLGRLPQPNAVIPQLVPPNRESKLTAALLANASLRDQAERLIAA